jgi:hypothetical protein
VFSVKLFVVQPPVVKLPIPVFVPAEMIFVGLPKAASTLHAELQGQLAD